MACEAEKPRCLFHGSPVGGLKVLDPRTIHPESARSQPVVFASPHAAVASCFLFRWHDYLAKLGTWDNGRTWVFRVREPDRIEFTGGSIYRVALAGFVHNPGAGLGANEWMSCVPVVVLGEERWESGLEAMAHYGVRVRWPVDQVRAVAALREGLVGAGFHVSPWDAFIASLPSRFDLLVLRDGPSPATPCIYAHEGVRAVLDVEGVAPFDKWDPQRVGARFDAVRYLDERVLCAYVLVTEAETAYARPTPEFLGFPVYELRRDPEGCLRPSHDWRRLTRDLSGLTK